MKPHDQLVLKYHSAPFAVWVVSVLVALSLYTLVWNIMSARAAPARIA